MDASTLTIHWHDDSQPIYSVSFQPDHSRTAGHSFRVATAGGDNNVRIWRVCNRKCDLADASSTQKPLASVEYLSTLRKHTQAVNCCRFSPDGSILATAGDDGAIILWKLADHILKDFEDTDNDDEPVESWLVVAQLRSSTSEIYDICWSHDGNNLIAASLDNALSIFRIEVTDSAITGVLLQSAKCHTHYVQGVAWDPLGEYVASQSADRLVLISKTARSALGDLTGITLLHRFNRIQNRSLYYPETLPSFFRRLQFSPDGAFLVTPAGVEMDAEGLPNDNESQSHTSVNEPQTSVSESQPSVNDSQSLPPVNITQSLPSANNTQSRPSVNGNNVYVYLRSTIDKTPAFKLSGLSKPAVAVSFSPVAYTSTTDQPLSTLKYAMLLAVATQDSVIVYTTDTFKPVGFISNLHFSSITDLAWYPDGSGLLVSSTDGFCSTINFEKDQFGQATTVPYQRASPTGVDALATISENAVSKPENVSQADTDNQPEPQSHGKHSDIPVPSLHAPDTCTGPAKVPSQVSAAEPPRSAYPNEHESASETTGAATDPTSSPVTIDRFFTKVASDRDTGLSPVRGAFPAT